MEIELLSIKKILNQKKIKLNTAMTQFSRYYKAMEDKFSSLNAVTHRNSRSTLPSVIKSYFLPHHPLHPIHIQKVPVNSSKHLVINIKCIRKILLIERWKEELHTFKIVISNWITYANSLIKILFPYNCKNILVHFFEKTILLFRSDNKTGFSAWKMLQTTTI